MMEATSLSPSPLSVYHVAVRTVENVKQAFTNFLGGEGEARVGEPMAGKAFNRWHALFPEGDLCILRRSDFFKIRALPKRVDQQLALLLGMNQGFRHGEVRYARFEHFKVDEGVLYVADSKRDRLYPLPLDLEVASVFEKLEPTENGYILQQENKWERTADNAVGKTFLWRKVKRWAAESDILNWDSFSPTYLRAFFAIEWVRKRVLRRQNPNIKILSGILRHKHPFYTSLYLSKFVFLEDLQDEMRQFQLGVQPSKVEKNEKPEENTL